MYKNKQHKNSHKIKQIKTFCEENGIQPENHPYVYVLRLRNKCYYVGYTNRFLGRMTEHLVTEKRVQWTNAHHPIEIAKVIDISNTKLSDPIKYETAETIRLINNYGVEKVRGGDFTTLDTKEIVRLLFKHGFVIKNNLLYQRLKISELYLNCMIESKNREMFKTKDIM